MTLIKIVSGGQTGVDRAALDAACEARIPSGGWCPKGRRAEDGVIPERYCLQETRARSYTVRTGWNVRDSDGTLILYKGLFGGGTELTFKMARQQGKPCFVVQLDKDPELAPVLAWIIDHDINVLNVAGPREAGRPGIYQEAKTFLVQLFLQRSSANGRDAKQIL